jgi:gliding motility-associated-like protein
MNTIRYKLKSNLCISLLFGGMLLFLVLDSARATHIKAGEISARFLNSREIEFSMFLYLKISALNELPELIEIHNTAEFAISDGRKIIVGNPQVSDIGNDTRLYIYTGKVNNAAGTLTISYSLNNRNNGILNINNGASDGTPFYIETRINLSSLNNLPRLTVAPIDEGTQNVIYTHNPGALDTEGDSLSYRLVVPMSGKNERSTYVPPNIARPGSSVSGGASTLSINPTKGDLIWDTPAAIGLYNVAIEITEWRLNSTGRRSVISVMIRDMQIEIKPNNNKRPEIIAKIDTCITAVPLGKIRDTIMVFDPDSIRPNNYQNVFLKSSSLPSIASIELIKPIGPNKLSNPGKALIVFDAGCANVRRLPYNITLEARDEVAPSIQLVTFKTISYTLLGPSPTGLRYNKDINGIQLRWDKYPCSNADSILIFRKDCDIAGFEPPLCNNSINPTGFIKIKSLPVTDTTWLDNDKIEEGSKYNYVLAVKFNRSSLGRSQYSEVLTCNFNNVPILTNISVLENKAADGAIEVKWLKPQKISNDQYEYKLYRKLYQSDQAYTNVFSSVNISDTVFLDKNSVLNTTQNQWEYKLEMYKNGSLFSSTETSSSVFLKAQAKNKRIELEWNYNTSWDNSEYKHSIYRRRISESNFTLIDSAVAEKNIGKYTNRGLDRKDTMCYYIKTYGRYCSDSIPKPFISISNEVCLSPSDSTKPCAPILSLIDENCNQPIDSLIKRPYRNELSWIYDDSTNEDCSTPTKGFNLYKALDQEADFVFYKFFPYETRSYTDLDFQSQTACYTITAVGENNIESDRSNIECNSNCVFYALPNLITPNGDEYNQMFNPMPKPVGVEKVRLFVYNRWGALIHFQETGPMLNWDPFKTNPNLSDGIYYYLAELTYERRVDPKKNKDSLKGWLHIMNQNKVNDAR